MVTRSAVTWGVLFGLLAAVSPGSAAMTVLIGAIIRLLQRRSLPGEAPFLIGLFVMGLLVRVVLLAVTNLAVVGANQTLAAGPERFTVPALLGDSGFSIIQAWRFVQFAQGHLLAPENITETFDSYGSGAHLLLFALFFALFGFSPFALTVLNCLLGTFAGLMAYSLTRALAGPWAGRMAGVLVAFFPSLLFWSITNLKDPLFIVLTLLMPWAWLRWHRTRSWAWLLIPLLVPFVLGMLRPKFLAPALASSVMGWWLLMLNRPQRWKVTIIVCAAGALLLARGVPQEAYDRMQRRAVSYHRGIVATGGFTYQLYPDEVYASAEPPPVSIGQTVRAYLKGWGHILVDPLPWKIRSPLSLAAAPQMALWYPFLLVAVLGIWRVLKRHPAFAAAIAFHLLCFGSAVVLGGGNVGTDFRMRDILTPLILCLSAIGLTPQPGTQVS